MLTLILLICFPFLIWGAWKNVRLSRESTGWPTVPGTITASERVKVMWRTQPRVVYTYEIDGKSYNGNKIILAGVPSKEIDQVLSRYPVGSTVTVSYLPGNPALALLQPGPNRYVSLLLRAYLIWFVIIIAINAADIFVALHNKPGNSADSTTEQPRTYDDTASSDTSVGDKLIQQGADNGDAQDEGYVGTWYLGGLEGYRKDSAEAAKWFLKSANQGDATSQSLLAELYAKGDGVPKDLTQAVQWFQKAADQGDPIGCVGIGRAYEKGIAGIPQDTQKAIEWYKKAGDNPLAKQALARLGAN
jgi:hypothetical protein